MSTNTRSLVVERAKKNRAVAAEVVQAPATVAEVPAPVPAAEVPVAVDPIVNDAEKAVADFQVLEEKIDTLQNQLDELETAREEFYEKFKFYGSEIAKSHTISEDGVKKLVEEFGEKFVETAGSLVGPMLRPMLRLDTFKYDVPAVQHGFSDDVVRVVGETVGIQAEIDYKPVMVALMAHIATATGNDPTVSGMALKTKIAWFQSKRISSGAAVAATGDKVPKTQGKLAIKKFSHPDFPVDDIENSGASFKIYRNAAGKLTLSKHDKNWAKYCGASGCPNTDENYETVMKIAKAWSKEWADENGLTVEVFNV